MELPSPVEVQDGVEGPRVAVKEISENILIVSPDTLSPVLLIIQERITRAELEDFLMAEGCLEPPKTRVWNVLEDPPHDLVSHSPNIEDNSLVDSPSPQYGEGLGTGVSTAQAVRAGT